MALTSTRRGISPIVEELAAVEGLEWIRLMYAFPTKFPEKILDVFRRTRNYVDILIFRFSMPPTKS